jgi:hypothetical protein
MPGVRTSLQKGEQKMLRRKSMTNPNRRKTMTSKAQRPRDQVHKVYNFILENDRLDPEAFASEACLLVSVDEGISAEAAVRGLRWIISSLRRKGLPWKDGPKVTAS